MLQFNPNSGPRVATPFSSPGRRERRDSTALRGESKPSTRYPVCLMKLQAIAEALGCRLVGDGDVEISGVVGMEHAGPGHLTFLANPKYAPKVKHTKASAILVSEPLPGVELACLVSANPYLDFARALALFYQPPQPRAGHSSAGLYRADRRGRRELLHRPVRGGWRARHALGRNAVLHPHVVIYEGARDRRRFPGAFARRGARVLPHRPSRDPAERRGGGRRRLRLRQARRRHALSRSCNPASP